MTGINKQQAKQLYDKTKESVYFIENCLGAKLWGKQKDIANSIATNEKTSVKSCHASGKSFVMSRIALEFLQNHEESIVITTAPTFRQVRDILWREIRAGYNQSLIELGGEMLQVAYNISDDWYGVGLSTNDPDKFQGYHAKWILVIVDEAAGVNNQIFEAIDSLLSTGNVRLALIGNPTSASGEFYNSFKGAGAGQYHKISISAFDTPNFANNDIRSIADLTEEKVKAAKVTHPYLITPKWAYNMMVKWGADSPIFQARVLGEFPSQADDTLIPLNKIEIAEHKQVVYDEVNDFSILSIDVARFGSDKTVMTEIRGNGVLRMDEYAKRDVVYLTGKGKEFINSSYRPWVGVDTIGLGAGLFDNLKSLSYNIDEIDFQEVIVSETASDPEKFVSLRDELWWRLREIFIDENIAIPLDSDLEAQLASIKFGYDNRGRIKVESKQDMKKRGLPSPDKADTLMMAMYKMRSQTSNTLQELVDDDHDEGLETANLDTKEW